ncbi:GAF domain-containing protein [Deminuibacter soli]|uniref:GAF domain-containing protein n=1 Tax=Deminuibacter soli TaxID=2291815 RepID=A0A3E1NPV5_9BACT|nr:GAF domain-containing protein [Deminuibacter soli]RFM29965.1 GAF domain-containing protein [Deminuibacter soli]
MTPDKNYDSAFCGSLPIHNINLVQPYGVLLVLDGASLQIVQASENAHLVFNLPVTELAGTPLQAHVGEAAVNLLTAHFDKATSNKIPFTLTVQDKQYLALAHAKTGYILVEIELNAYETASLQPFVSVFQELKYSMLAIEEAPTTAAMCTVAARELKKISGFDKVMIYHFDENWNGTVVAEEMEPAMESYMGFTFPASDIPRQARDLYQRNAYRLIPSREYTPVKLYPVINPVTHAFVDLSDCNMRAVAAVHIEYLKNMGVMASMSTRIMYGDKLWGLIACHHREAKYLSFEMCAVFELLSGIMSAKVTALNNKEQSLFNALLNESHARFIEQVYNSQGVTAAFAAGGAHLLSLFNATGAALIQQGKVQLYGQTPGAEELEELVFWLNARKLKNTWSETHLSSVFDTAHKYTGHASGLLAIPLNSNGDDYLLLFRPEVVRTVNWGGNPDEAIQFEGNTGKYHPRHSFKLWQQTFRAISLPWHDEELRMAEYLRSFIYEFNTRQVLP